MGFGLLLGIKGKLRTLFEDLGDSHAHPLKDTALRFFKWPMDEGSLIIAVPPNLAPLGLQHFPRSLAIHLVLSSQIKWEILEMSTYNKQ